MPSYPNFESETLAQALALLREIRDAIRNQPCTQKDPAEPASQWPKPRVASGMIQLSGSQAILVWSKTLEYWYSCQNASSGDIWLDAPAPPSSAMLQEAKVLCDFALPPPFQSAPK